MHYTRVFVVGPRADVASLVGELTKTAGGATGAVRVELNDAGKVDAGGGRDDRDRRRRQGDHGHATRRDGRDRG